MERRVKERLIGASILVVLLVLIVPELLSGPPKKPPPPVAVALPAPSGPASDAVRNVTVDLNTSRPTQQEEPLAEPSPAAAPDNPVVSDSAPAATVAHPTPPPQAAPSMAPASVPAAHPSLDSSRPSPTSAGAWAVQLGSFANRDNAEKLVHQLAAQSYAVYVAPQGAGKSQRFRVRVGPLADKGAADRTVARLKAQGHAGSIVSPGH